MLEAKLKTLPEEPGVYLMKDQENSVIYVGKAKSLKNRVRSYFVKSDSLTFKTQKLVEKITDFEVILVKTELEALLLERNLIKLYEPKYNVLFRDDKQYPYIRIDLNEDWPRFKKVRKKKMDEATYLGPYANPSDLYRSLQVMNKIFPLIRCSEHEFKNAIRPCHYFHMKQCLAPCTQKEKVTPTLYKTIVLDALNFLEGKDKNLKEKIHEKMMEASAVKNYELAALYRDQFQAFDNYLEWSKTSESLFSEYKTLDVLGVSVQDEEVCVEVLSFKDYKLAYSTHFNFLDPLNNLSDAIKQFLLEYYLKRFIPDYILLSEQIKIEDLSLLALALEKPDLKFLFSSKDSEKHLIQMAEKNAIYHLEQKLKEQDKSIAELSSLQMFLKLDFVPRFIECIDISNLGAKAIVASSVLFKNAVPDKSGYRRYQIETLKDKHNDFASIYEVTLRRLKRFKEENKENLDLLVIDGGAKQLSFALKAQEELGLTSPKIISLAKAKSKFKTMERIFLDPKSESILLEPGSRVFRLLTHLRDEAHRFAITYHREKLKELSF